MSQKIRAALVFLGLNLLVATWLLYDTGGQIDPVGLVLFLIICNLIMTVVILFHVGITPDWREWLPR